MFFAAQASSRKPPPTLPSVGSFLEEAGALLRPIGSSYFRLAAIPVVATGYNKKVLKKV